MRRSNQHGKPDMNGKYHLPHVISRGDVSVLRNRISRRQAGLKGYKMCVFKLIVYSNYFIIIAVAER